MDEADSWLSGSRLALPLAPMKPLAEDTPPEIEAILLEGYRRMSAREKLERVCQMRRAVQQLALARISAQYPASTEKERRLRLASLWLTREQMLAAFGWDPEQEGY
jgi:hypothetical protein